MKRFFTAALPIVLDILFIVSLVFVLYFSYPDTWEDFWLILALGCVFFLLSLVIIPVLHELGHLLIGKLCGMRLIGITLSFVEIIRLGDKLTYRFVNPVTLEVAGSCRMYPADGKNIEKKYLLFASGGLIFNLFYLIIGLPLVIIFNTPFLWATLGITLPYCAYLFIVNLLPFSETYDGAILWGLLKGDSSQITAVRLFTAQGYLAQGLTPSQIDKKLYFDLPQLSEDDVNFAILQYYRYTYFLDNGEEKEAFKSITRLEECLEYIPDVYLTPILAELVFAYSYLEINEELAERYHARMERQEDAIHAIEAVRAKAAYARLKNNEKGQREALDDLKTLIEQEPLLGVKKYEEKILKDMYGI